MTKNLEFGEGYMPRRLTRRKRSRVRTIVIVALVLVLAAGMTSGAYVLNLANTFNKQTQQLTNAFPDEENRPVKDPSDGSINFLLMGVDSGSPNQAPTELLSHGGTGQRSDSLMFVHIPGDRSGVYVMSVVRDMWTEIPGHGMNKINSAMSFGGVPLVVQTVEGLFDTKIDHVALIDFQGFRDLSTALGGVKVKNEIPFTANDTDYFYPVGELNLEGDRALRFVRERKSFINGDYQRVENQQKFIKAVIAKMLAADTLTNPTKVFEVIDKVSPYLTLDSGLDASAAAGIGLQLKGLRPKDVKMFTLPTLGSGKSADGQSIELKDSAAIDAIGKAMRTDSLTKYLAENPPK